MTAVLLAIAPALTFAALTTAVGRLPAPLPPVPQRKN